MSKLKKHGMITLCICLCLAAGGCGRNAYAADESEDFKDAIMRQLAMQIGNSDAQLDGYGSTTDAGDVEYVFTITDDDGSVTKQYYIVGDRRFCLIQLSNYTGSDAADDAADEMADSFVWDD